MPNDAATQHRPAEKPAATAGPRPKLRPRNIAKTAAATKLSTNASPKIMPMLPLFACSSDRPAADCHDFANSAGEYHRPPSTSELTAHSKTAIQFTSGI